MWTSAGTVYQYSVNLRTQYRYVLIKYWYIVFTQYRIHVTIIECLSCTCAVPVSLICSQLFGVKAHGCISLFYVCYSLV